MASPEPPRRETTPADLDRAEETIDSVAAVGHRSELTPDRVALPVYRPRKRVAMTFWLAFALGAVLAAGVVLLIIA
ncbi:MAG: hypothetical protein ABI345_09835 [Jatrophihabitans sp.]